MLNQHGSRVLLGNTLMVPVGQSIVYLRPLYVASSSIPQPQLTYVIGVLGQKVVIKSTVAQTLSSLLKTPVIPGGSQGNPVGPAPAPAPVRFPQPCSRTWPRRRADYTARWRRSRPVTRGRTRATSTPCSRRSRRHRTPLAPTATTTTTPTTTTTTTPTTTPSKSTKTKSEDADQHRAQDVDNDLHDLDDFDLGDGGASGAEPSGGVGREMLVTLRRERMGRWDCSTR